VRVLVVGDRGRRYDSGSTLAEAGVITIDVKALGFGGEQTVTITVEARSPFGSDRGRLRLLSRAE
jgi:hypothetical protein